MIQYHLKYKSNKLDGLWKFLQKYHSDKYDFYPEE